MPVIDRRTLLISTGALMVLPSLPALSATTHDIEMLNKDPDDKKRKMVFKPLIQIVQPGDVVKFIPSDKGHNSESIKGMIPDGTEKWKSKVNKEIEVAFDKPGFYGYKCTPHYATGMVGLIICEGEGKMNNLEAAKGAKLRGKAKKVFASIWEQAEADGLLA